MQAIRVIGLIAALAANCAYGQSGPSGQSPAASETTESLQAQQSSGKEPVAVARPPAPPQLAPLSPDFQTAMANSQLQTYRYNQLTDQALALKKLCDTGFGPSDICPKANAAAGAGFSMTNVDALPVVAEISGRRGALSAVLVLADGRRVSVRAGSVLADGLHIQAVTEEDVRVSNGSGHQLALPFGDGVPTK